MFETKSEKFKKQRFIVRIYKSWFCENISLILNTPKWVTKLINSIYQVKTITKYSHDMSYNNKKTCKGLAPVSGASRKKVLEND